MSKTIVERLISTGLFYTKTKEFNRHFNNLKKYSTRPSTQHLYFAILMDIESPIAKMSVKVFSNVNEINIIDPALKNMTGCIKNGEQVNVIREQQHNAKE